MKTRIAQLMTFAFCLAGSAAAAATDTTWRGGAGGTAAEPLDLYSAANWASGVLPSDKYNLALSVASPTHLTNSFANATTTRIADNIYFNSGDFFVHGPLRFYSFKNKLANASVSIVKTGDWWIDYYTRIGEGAPGSKMAFTNESGNIVFSQQAESRFPETENSRFDAVSKKGNWTFSGGNVIFAYGKNSVATIDKQAGNWSFANQLYLASGEGSTADFRNRAGSLNVVNTMWLGEGKNSKVNFYVSGGAVTAKQYGFVIGKDTSGSGRVYFEVSGGAVTNLAGNILIGESEGSGSSVEMRVTGGDVCAAFGSICVGSHGAATLAIDGGRVSATANGVKFCAGTEVKAGMDARLDLNGGTLAAKTVTYGSGAANATFKFNGGTLEALQDGTLIENKPRLAVTVAAGGGVIDANGHSVTIAEPLLADAESAGGGMTFKGGGSVVLASGSTYTGKTTVEIGTKVLVATPAEIGGGLAVALPRTALAPGKYTVLVTTGSTAFDASVLEGASVPEDCELLLEGGKSVVCIYKRSEMAAGIWLGMKSNDLCDGDNWSRGTVPNGGAAVISCGAASTLVCNGSFTPSSITFPEESALVTISGPGPISGVSSIVNNTSLHHVFNCPIACADGATPAISRVEANYMRFPGGISMHNVPKTGNDVQDWWSGNVTVGTTDSSQLQFHFTNKNHLRLLDGTFSITTGCVDRVVIQQNARLSADCLVYSGCARVGTSGNSKGWYSTVFDNGNGTIRVGEIKTSGDAALFHSFASADMYGGTIIADKLTCAATKAPAGAFPYPCFFLNCGSIGGKTVTTGAANGEGVWAIGPGGLSYPKTSIYSGAHYETSIGKTLDGRPAATLYSFADWTLMAHPNGRTSPALQIGNLYDGHLRIDTSHYQTGEAAYDTATSHKVTLDGAVTGGGWMLATGTGKIVFANENNSFSGRLLVSNSVRIVVNSGCKPGTGKVELRNTSTLELKSGASAAGAVDVGYLTTLLLPDTGNVTVGGQLWMRNSSKMKFRIDGSENAKVLAGSYKIEKGVEISFTEDSVPLVGRSYTLTQGAEFTDAMLDSGTSPNSYFKLANGTRGTLSVENGELVYTAPTYFFIKVR